MSAANHVEAAMVVESRMGDEGGRQLDNFVETAEIETRGHYAGADADCASGLAQVRQGLSYQLALNFGDCFAYALAEATGEPLLFKGEDFTLTDIEVA